MKELICQSLRLFKGRLVLKIAVATIIPVTVVAGLGFFWEYRVALGVVGNVIVNERIGDALALATVIEAARDPADLQTIVANYWRQAMAKPRDGSVSLGHASASEIFIVGPSGVVLAASSRKLIGQPLVEAMGHGPMGLLAVLREREAYRSEFTAGNGRKVLHVSVPLRFDPQAPVRITGTVHLTEPFGPVKRALWPHFWRPPLADPCNAACHTVLEYALWGPAWRRAFAVLALSLALAASLTVILGLVVVAPVKRLTEATRSASEGLEVTVPVTSRDEIGDLTQSFNHMVAELHRKATTLGTLYAIDRTLSQSLDLEVVLSQALEKTCEAIAVEAGGFYLLEADGETLVLRVHRGLSPAFAEAVGRLRLGEGVSGQAIALRRPVAMAMADYPTPRLAPILATEGVRHLASAPVIASGRVVGAINVGSHRERPFTEEELEFLGSIGQQVGVPVVNAQLHAVTARQTQQLAMLAELTRRFTTVLEPPAAAQEILSAVQALIPGSAGHLWERMGDDGLLNLVAGVGLRDPRGGQKLRFYSGEGLTGIAAATRQPVISPDVTQDPRFVNQAWAAAEGLVSCIALPLVYGERIHGGLAIFTRTAHTFTDDEVSLLRSFAAQAAIAIENARLYGATLRQLTEMATLHDMGRAIASTLTLDERLQAILERLVRAAGAQRATIGLVDARDATRCRLCVGYDSSKTDPWLRHLDLSSERYPEIQEAMRTRQRLVIPDISAEPLLAPLRELLERLGLRSLVVVPLIAREQVTGAVSLGYVGQGRSFSDDEIRFFESMADLAAAAIANAQLFEQVARAKAEWENTFDAMPEMVAIIDGEYHLVRVNRAMAERLTVAPGDLVGQRCCAVMHGTDAPCSGCPLPQALATGRPASREIEEPHLGGIFHVTTSPLVDADGRPALCVHIARDITELKRLEEEARQRQRFEDLSRAKSAFIATMSHELRSPLNAVMGFSELLLRQGVGPLTEKQARYLGHIHESGKHLLDMINDILNVSRVDAGKIELAREPVRLDDTAEATLALIRPQAEKAGVVLGMDIPPSLPPVWADRVRLREILFNLLSNGIKFTPAGGTVSLTARRCPQPLPESPRPGEGTFLEISVRDTGIGIKGEDIPKLFKEFGQLEAGRAHEKRGTGLGLALTKRLVELHGGRMWVESEGEGGGSTFGFTLPPAERLESLASREGPAP